ncbi:hypothetical protein V5F31_14765 [Xanthobacter sp. V7C-4]|uniref:hypothetical protein n=1 Tax=Xanthobacter autotrophicus (strain ATCC BAA-1158 / Py2) TaxID=78245 RepID=UPI00372C4E21
MTEGLALGVSGAIVKAAPTTTATQRMFSLARDEIAYFSANAGLPQKPMISAGKRTIARFHDIQNAKRGKLPISV